ncbi:MAG: hypothetical protein UW41_C0005G0048 [Candidatus Collierbacteria bacterium GW2011_GWC2_44_18]|uniref:Antitoxin n=2 Tax=Microgenomates group TaxID=1794810 RepID=A0A0G1J8U2_9BACT|nr:MAG: hypothetical protein UW16_C0001G0004 [Microgenomates group bacterium GW2011_GWC1_44_10]KKT49545.1 MAG: hypothetical protein UW41_C0005G0048 [Candidatus Collierbacteria bacterium GW2011_GWC2_44_18]KKT67783.1 MAG: hypothetical protein UW60_C0001G0061 [Candidatus Woesebacteria bacterium GW2011_GWA2_44_33]
MPIKKTSSSDLIVKDPEILGGTPVITGTRIPVTLLARLLRVGYSDKIINYEYPSLTMEKILAFKKLIDGGYRVSASR